MTAPSAFGTRVWARGKQRVVGFRQQQCKHEHARAPLRTKTKPDGLKAPGTNTKYNKHQRKKEKKGSDIPKTGLLYEEWYMPVFSSMAVTLVLRKSEWGSVNPLNSHDN